MIGAIIVSVIWGGGLLAVYKLRPRAAASPAAAEIAGSDTPAATQQASIANPAVPLATGMFAGIESSSAPAVVDGLPSIDDRRQKIEAFWAQANGNDSNGPHGRWEARTGSDIPATMPTTAATADPLTSPTLVSVHIKDLSSRSAMSQLTRQTGVRFSLDQNQYWQGRPYPKISLDADNKPLLEVVNEYCCKTGLAPVSNKFWGMGNMPTIDGTNPRMLLTLQDPDNAMGPWMTSGAFAFEIQQISHSAELAFGQDASTPLVITMGVEHEPQVTLLSQLQSPDLIEAVDEKGHHLLQTGVAQPAWTEQPHAAGLLGMLFGSHKEIHPAVPSRNWSRNNQPAYLNLSYPPDAGRTIARLRARQAFLVQTKFEHIETDLTLNQTAPTKNVGGLNYIVGPLATPMQQQITCHVQFKRGSRSQNEFDQFTAAITSRRPDLLDEQGSVYANIQVNQNSSDSDSVTFDYSWWVQNYGSNGADSKRKPAKLVFDIPTEWKVVEVPIAFDNLPLP